MCTANVTGTTEQPTFTWSGLGVATGMITTTGSMSTGSLSCWDLHMYWDGGRCDKVIPQQLRVTRPSGEATRCGYGLGMVWVDVQLSVTHIK